MTDERRTADKRRPDRANAGRQPLKKRRLERRLAFEQMEARRLFAGLEDLHGELLIEPLGETLGEPLGDWVFKSCQDEEAKLGEAVRVDWCADGRFVLNANVGLSPFDRTESHPQVAHQSSAPDTVSPDSWTGPASGQSTETAPGSTIVATIGQVSGLTARPTNDQAIRPEASDAATASPLPIPDLLPAALFTPLGSSRELEGGGPNVGSRASPSASTLKASGLFSLETPPRRVNWSLRNESLAERDQALTQMTVWSGANPADARDSSAQSMTAWRESARRKGKPVILTRADLEAGAWAAKASGGAVGAQVAARGAAREGSHQAIRQVEKVTLDAAVGSSLATVQWAQRWMRGEAIDSAGEAQAAGDSEIVETRPWAASAAVLFSLLQAWRERRRSRKEVGPFDDAAQ